jgi:hypothetical protein
MVESDGGRVSDGEEEEEGVGLTVVGKTTVDEEVFESGDALRLTLNIGEISRACAKDM